MLEIWFLTIYVFGIQVFQAKEALSQEACREAALVTMVSILEYAESRRPPPIFLGREVTLKDVSVTCEKGQASG